MQDQLTKQVARLCELLKKDSDLQGDGLLDEGNDPALDNIDIMSDTSTQITAFTRYTMALSAVTTASSSHRSRNTTWRQANEKKKKEQKKKATGKKGTVYEESYLYESLQRLLKERLKAAQGEPDRTVNEIACTFY